MNLGLTLSVLGALFLAGLAADQLGRRTKLPRVTLLLACGLIVGKAGFDVIPEEISAWYEPLSVVALTMVAFLLGGSLSRETLAAHGRAIVVISLVIVVVTAALVAGGLVLFNVALPTALVIGAIATATAPASTRDTIAQEGRDTGFTRTLQGIVAIDDAWAMIVFSIVLVIAKGLIGAGIHVGLLTEAAYEIGGAVALGLALGVPGAYLTGRLQRGEPSQSEALGLVFLTAGLSLLTGVSFLIAGMVAGAVIVNMARHHKRPFSEIEHVQWPFMLLFFLLAGASLELGALAQIGGIGVAYVVLRIVARIVGGWIGARIAGVPRKERSWYGPALLAQAGVAVGMGLVAAQELPGQGELILTLVIGSTVVFEILGPVATAMAVRRVAQKERG